MYSKLNNYTANYRINACLLAKHVLHLYNCPISWICEISNQHVKPIFNYLNTSNSFSVIYCTLLTKFTKTVKRKQ